MASYLIRRYGYTVDEAVKLMQSKRPPAFTPKINFIIVLEWWKAKCLGKVTDDMPATSANDPISYVMT